MKKRSILVILVGIVVIFAGLMIAASNQKSQNIIASPSPAGRTYTTDADFDEGELVGVEHIEISENIPFGRKIISLFNISWTTPEFKFIFPEAVPSQHYFDIDLQAYTYDGQKIGMNYTTMEYLLPDNVRASGNIPGGGPEWISIPRDEKVYYVVDATPARKWAEEFNLTLENLTATWQMIYYDENGVRRESDPITVNISLEEPSILAIQADIDIDPDVLNIKSKGKWITAYIELPLGYNVSQIDINSVILNYTVPAENNPKYGFVKDLDSRIGDYDGDGIPDLMVKFDREAVKEMILERGGEIIKLDIIGEVVHKQVPILFKGSDVIKIISK